MAGGMQYNHRILPGYSSRAQFALNNLLAPVGIKHMLNLDTKLDVYVINILIVDGK
jgi:hypothetical protein